MRRGSSRTASDRWFRLLLRLYPVDFRDEMGEGVVNTYLDRARDAFNRGGLIPLARVWLVAFFDSLWNGLGERTRPAVSWRRHGDWGRDFERVLRRFRRSPVFVAVVLGTLTVGLGAFTVVYTAVDKILIEPLPYSDPEDLYLVWRDASAYSDLDRGRLTGPDVEELRRAGGAIQAAAGLRLFRPTLSVTTDGSAYQVTALFTSPNLFDLLGVPPALGRGFESHEVGPGRPPVVVLTDSLWRLLGADTAVVGSEIRLNGNVYTVIGVMPPHFRFVFHGSAGLREEADIYLPFPYDLATENLTNATHAGLIRARHGSSPEQVAAAVDSVGRLVDQRDNQGRGLELYPIQLLDDLVASVRSGLVVLGFAGALLVVVLTVNLASLLFARAADREREFTVSRALGANGVAVAGATLVEGVLLGLIGGATGALAGVWGTRLMVALAPLDLPRRATITVDWGIALVVVAVGAALGLAAATAPAIWASRLSPASTVEAGGVRGGARPLRMRGGLVVAEIALSLSLLSAGALVARSFGELLAVDPGFEPEGVLTFYLSPLLFDERADVANFYDRAEAVLADLPGATAVGAMVAVPLGGTSPIQGFVEVPAAPGNTGNPEYDHPLADLIAARPGTVEALGMRLLAGRDFDTATPDGEVLEALIDDDLARQFFPEGNAVGATMTLLELVDVNPALLGLGPNATLRISGVVQHVRLYDLYSDGRPQIFLRSGVQNPYASFFAIRTEREETALIPGVRSAIRQIDPRVPVSDVRTMDEIVTDALRQERISAVLIAGFALGALLLVMMGLFGVVSGSVARRRAELAVRLALGATHGRVLRTVLQEGARLIGLGLLLGIPGVYVSGQAIRGILFGVSPFDVTTLMVVAAGLASVTLFVSYFAARRVLTIEPSRLLRAEG